MAEKILNTRIALKYDSLANWQVETEAGKGANLVLKAGEVGFVYIPTGSSQSTTVPTVMFKVGDGTTAFKSLPWGAAQAADVYSWAKASSKPEYAASEITGLEAYIKGKVQDTNTTYQIVEIKSGETVTGYKLQKHELTEAAGTWTDVSTIDVMTDAEVNALIDTKITALDLPNTYEEKGAAATVKTELLGDAATDYNTLGKLEDKIIAEASRADTAEKALLGASTDPVEKATIYGVQNAVAAENTRASRAESILTTSVQGVSDRVTALESTAVTSVTGSKSITVDNTTAKTPVVGLKIASGEHAGNVTLTDSANGLSASVTIPAATVTGVKSGDKVLALDGTELTSTLDLTYDSTAKKIYLKGISGTVIAEVNAADFIKDGMVNNVTFDPATKKLTITFNTDAGKQAIDVDLSSLVDTYTAGNGIAIAGNVISAKIDSASESYLTVGEGGLKISGINAALALKADASDVAEISTKVTKHEGILDGFGGTDQPATVIAELNKKVDKETGKGLSTNDYTTAEQTKLAGISTGANKVEASTTNGNIKIDGTETTVYTEVANTVHDANYKHITVTGTSVSDGTNTFNKYDDTALAGRVTTIEGKEATWDAKQDAITDGSATIATVSNDVVTLKAAVGQSAGAVTQGTGSDITLSKLAKTANVNDLVQTSGDVLVFNCGSSTTVL